MSFIKSFFISLSVITCQLISTQADTIINIRNNCPFTVWAAAVPGGGRRLAYGAAWRIPQTNLSSISSRRIWGRTNCNFDTSGRGQCQIGDCKGLLECQDYGTPPVTLAEYTLNLSNNKDYFDISLVDGFNLPMEFSPASTDKCSARISCTADIIGQCPNELRTPGGCNSPCTVFKTDLYCCRNKSNNCGPTNLSKFFKDRCSTSYSYPKDDTTSLFNCPSGINYRVVFCP
ncbi:thaumatin-like protein 1 [Lycium barbarum]|uniref:thaumatin-like protein 1 n=1 Tax=Lycium barbarum TaxID=112863 RepID=UPI00293EE103|nr:thaumatin-like protein 1 [Lycium barbarum]